MLVEFTSEAQLKAHYVRTRARACPLPPAPARWYAPRSSVPESTLIQAATHQWGPWIAPEKKAPIVPAGIAKQATILQIKYLVCGFFGLTSQDMTSQQREQPRCRARQIAMYLCCRLTGLSLPQIGRQFGGRDHTTVLHARRRIEELRTIDTRLELQLRELEDGLHG